jgi:hypothetical protein
MNRHLPKLNHSGAVYRLNVQYSGSDGKEDFYGLPLANSKIGQTNTCGCPVGNSIIG